MTRAPILAAFLAVGLAACVPAPAPAPVVAPAPPPAPNADIAALDASTRAFVRDAAIADLYARTCAEDGLRLAAGDAAGASQAFLGEMTGRGYAAAQVVDAIGRVDQAAAGQDATRYLSARGLSQGDADALICTSAQGEIAEGTPVGRLLVAA